MLADTISCWPTRCHDRCSDAGAGHAMQVESRVSLRASCRLRRGARARPPRPSGTSFYFAKASRHGDDFRPPTRMPRDFRHLQLVPQAFHDADGPAFLLFSWSAPASAVGHHAFHSATMTSRVRRLYERGRFTFEPRASDALTSLVAHYAP